MKPSAGLVHVSVTERRPELAAQARRSGRNVEKGRLHLALAGEEGVGAAGDGAAGRDRHRAERVVQHAPTVTEGRVPIGVHTWTATA